MNSPIVAWTWWRRLLAAALVTLVALAAHPAQAQEEPNKRAQAQVIFKEGQVFFEEGRFREAAARFLSAFQLDPHPVIMFNIARAYEEAGDLLKALQHFRAAQGLNPSQAVAAEIKVKIQDLEGFLREQGVDILNIEAATWVPRGFVSVISDPPGAEIYIAGQLVGRAPLDKVTLTQGTYQVIAKRRGFVTQEREINVVGGKTYLLKPRLMPGSDEDPAQRVQSGALDISAPRRGLLVFVDGEPIASTPVGRLELRPGTHSVSIEGDDFPTYEQTVEVKAGEVIRVVAPLPKKPELEKKDTSLLSHQEWSWVLLGSGAGSLGVGALLGTLALSDAGTYQDERSSPDRPDVRARARALGIGADVFYVLGLGLLTTGAFFYLMDDQTQEPSQYGDDLVLWPQLMDGGAGVGARASW